MSTTQFLIDATSRRSIFTQRYADGVANIAELQVSKILREVSALLLEQDVAGISSAMRGSLELEIIEFMSVRYQNVTDEFLEGVIEFAGREAAFTGVMLETGTTIDSAIPVPRQTLEIATLTTFMQLEDEGISLTNALSEFGDKKTRQVINTISLGVNEGLTSQEVVKRVRQLTPMHRRQASSLVRTGTNAVATTARMESLQANKDILLGYEWVSTLDSHTSLICIGRDGIVYEFSPNSPRPPAHWSCRSAISPKVNPRFDLASAVTGKRPSVGSDGAKQVSANLTYSGFLRNQSKEFQNEVLGPERAKLFRSGQLTLDKFTDDSGRTYTLAELESLNNLSLGS